MTVTLPESANRKRVDSPRMAALRKVDSRGVVQMCPYGCGDAEHGGSSYCYHVVGTTIPGSKTIMEPMGWDKAGRRVTNGGVDANGKPIVPERQRVQPGDELQEVTGTSIVFRKTAPVPKWLREDELLAEENLEKELAEEEKERLQLAGKL